MIRVLVLVALLFASSVQAEPVKRDRAEVRAFRSTHPCPATGLYKGRCDGYEIDHRIALVCGGPDHRDNLQWLPTAAHRYKTRVDLQCKRLRRAEQTAQ